MPKHTPGNSFQRKNGLVEVTDEFLLHLLVDFSIAGEGAAAFSMAAKGTDEVGVFDLLVEVAYEGSASEMAACYLIDRLLLFKTSHGFRMVTILVIPQSLKIFLMATLYFC